jgi:hypothetical protein
VRRSPTSKKKKSDDVSSIDVTSIPRWAFAMATRWVGSPWAALDVTKGREEGGEEEEEEEEQEEEEEEEEANRYEPYPRGHGPWPPACRAS